MDIFDEYTRSLFIGTKFITGLHIKRPQINRAINALEDQQLLSRTLLDPCSFKHFTNEATDLYLLAAVFCLLKCSFEPRSARLSTVSIHFLIATGSTPCIS